MTKRLMGLRVLILAGCFLTGAGMVWGQMAAPAVNEAAVPSGILPREKAAGFLPDKVFYRGQSASVQARNSAGVAFSGGKLMLAVVVDTSGYSSAISQRYQAYLMTEVPLRFGGKVLVPGCYGFGFVGGDTMVVMDVGANQLLEAATAKDAAMKRPNPLQIVADPSKPGHYRLYMGRTYVVFSQAAGK
jgi:hypothetical protein